MRLIYILIFSVLFANGQNANFAEIGITPNSFLQIKGTTSLNSFQCSYNHQLFSQKIPLSYTQEGSNLYFYEVAIKLENSGFNCGNRAINKDFHELLQTETYPHIYFELLRINNQNNVLNALISIKIAGVKKQYKVAINSTDKLYTASGVLCLNITDFGLNAPRKLMGIIIVNEEIEIHFGFNLNLS